MENIVYTNEQLALKLAVDGRNTSARNSTAALEVANKYLKWLNENKTKRKDTLKHHSLHC